MNEKKPKKGHRGDDDGLFLVLDGIYKVLALEQGMGPYTR